MPLSAFVRFALPIAAGVAIWFSPRPEALQPAAWQLLALFVATIAGIIAKPLPMGAVAVLGIAATSATGTLPLADALSGFANPIIWLIVAAFFFSRGFVKTGLGARLAYLFLRALGARSLGVGYGLALTDLVLAPGIPSNTARTGGVVFPILRSIALAYDSRPDDGTARRIGAFLTQVAFQATVITSAMFLTAMAANPLAAKIAQDQGIEISWGTWALAASVPGLVSLVLVPLLLYVVYPPEVKRTPETPELARRKLVEMGPMSSGERILLVTLGLLLALWIFGEDFGIDSTTTALLGLALLLLSGVLDWTDVLSERNAWDTLIWFSALVMMASFLDSLGFIPWFSVRVSAIFEGLAWGPAFLGLALVYFYSHYLFASSTAHVSAMYGAFLAVAVAVGTPPLLAALVLGFFSNLFSSMTHYGCGPAPVLFGGGYVELADWWRLGALVAVVNIAIWLGVGSVWWRILGIY